MTHIHDLADEILLQILSRQYLPDPPRDLINVAVTSRRLHPVALTQLYRAIRFMPRSGNIEFVTDLQSFISCLEAFPERARWVESASFGWLKMDLAIPQKLETIFKLLNNLREICLIGTDPFRFNHIQGPTIVQSLLRAPASSSLRIVRISHPRMSVQDIQSLYSLPDIEDLTINSWNYTSSSQPDANVVPPPTRLRSLHFQQSSLPSGPVAKILLQGHQQLKELLWTGGSTTTRALLSPKNLMESIGYLSSSLVSLELRIGLRAHPNDGTHIDVSKFNVLQTLVVDERFLFKSLVSQDDPAFQHCQPTKDPFMYQRLPISLEILQVGILSQGTSLASLTYTR